MSSIFLLQSFEREENIWMTSTSEFVSNEKSRRKILEKIREQNVPNSQLFQEFLVEYELLAEYRLLQVHFLVSLILKPEVL